MPWAYQSVLKEELRKTRAIDCLNPAAFYRLFHGLTQNDAPATLLTRSADVKQEPDGI